MKKLVIVESPHKGDNIRSYLNGDYIVKATRGHITTLVNSGTYNTGVDFSNKYKPKYVLMDDKLQTLKDLVDSANKSDEIIIATDNDRSGIFIGNAIAERLADLDKPMSRVIFKEITKKGVNSSINNKLDIALDFNTVMAEQSRSVLDKIVGFMVSPFLMTVCGQNLSAGRVQSVAARLIIDREKEINDFKSETYFTISANVATLDANLKQDKKFMVKYDKKLTDQKIATDIFNKINTSDFEVESIKDDFEYKQPHPPMITSTLQQMMASIHGFDADRTMKSAQSLYENGYCTYIRTDSVRAEDEAVKEAREWLTNSSIQIPSTPNEYKNKDAAQDAHECIRPTQLSLEPDNNYAMTDEDDKKTYEVIWRYFVASQASAAKYSTRKITIKSSTNPSIKLKTSGKALIEANFLDVLGQSDDSEITIPSCVVGDRVILQDQKSVILDKKKTQPPPRYALPKLLKELENRGIGRPATYAEILTKIVTRNYVEKKGNVYYPTELGIKINDILVKYFSFVDYDFTKRMEDDLDKVDQGKLTYLEMMEKFFPLFKEELKKAYIDNDIKLCQNCEFPIRTSKNGNEYCSNYVNCKYVRNNK
jgi:DNA topoisomerase-1